MEETQEADEGARRRKMPLRGEEATFSLLLTQDFTSGSSRGERGLMHVSFPLCAAH